MADNKKICFITYVDNEDIYKETLLYIKNLNVPEGYQIETLCIKNVESITKAYNKGIQDSDAKYKVYIHEDVFIINKNLIKNFMSIFENNNNVGMIGVLGSKTIPTSGIWNKSKHKYGKVYDNQTGKLELLQFNEIEDEYESVKAIDSLIMITQYDIPWKETIFDGHCFYDISQSLEFTKSGYKVVIPKQDEPWCIHECGATHINDENEKYRKIFLGNYSKDIFPLVSIFVEACGRISYFKTALDSVVNQTYKNIEIIVIDRSLNNECKEITKPYLKKYPNIKYYKCNIFQDTNILNTLLKLSSGEYISYISDTDIYHKDRINIMINYFLECDNVSLVTSYRELIDAEGKQLKNSDIPRKLFDKSSITKGNFMFNLILKKISDVIDEIISPLFSRKIIENIEKDIQNSKFGIYKEKQDKIIANLLTWISTIDKEKVIYISDPLSYFRVHDIRDQRKINTILHKILEHLINKNDEIKNEQYSVSIKE
ncbi:glycosyltransferase [Anaeromicrobium sediminis]|uniref:Uncharacterized protein n=1 Tax=Anaeromicrobium sediminis TaxID=1478221 RepID=A0A267MPK1_9FIRM|nr:glycosyltransferase [Anaeromicrobium sediminis]PAB60660.1 hypothetical protein CCE28_03720 [Anaeromicrobium sediminis]